MTGYLLDYNVQVPIETIGQGFFSDAGLTDEFKMTILDAGNII